MRQDAHDSLPDRIERRGAEAPLAAVIERRLALLPVEKEVPLKRPVQKHIVAHERVREGAVGLGGRRRLPERGVRGDLGLEDGQGGRLWFCEVAAEVGGQEALHVCGDGGGDEDALAREAGGADGRDDGVLAFEGGGDGVEGGEVGFADLDRGWVDGRRGRTLDGGDGEFAGLDERVEHGPSEGSGGLERGWISVVSLDLSRVEGFEPDGAAYPDDGDCFNCSHWVGE